MFMPLFAALYPANAEFFCKMLLEVASFDAIPADTINDAIWSDALELSEETEVDIGKSENLGFDGPNGLPNLTSSLVMFTMFMVFYSISLCISSASCCFWCLQRKRRECHGIVFWNFPISFLMGSYSVISICCLINLKHFSSDERAAITVNSAIAVVLLIFLVVYPILIQCFLYKNRKNLSKNSFKNRF